MARTTPPALLALRAAFSAHDLDALEPVDSTDDDAGIHCAVGNRPERSPAVPR
jgi:hypothetical protein